ncbi:MAG: DUF503 domain-containing protein [Calditrichia bacterium]
MAVIIGLLTAEIFIPSANSLKEKRMVVKGLKDKIHNKFNVSVSEVDYQDKWQRALLGIAQVGNDYGFIEKNLNKIFNLIESNNNVEIIDHSFEYL